VWVRGVRVERVTILDAAREGMNPDIRPQDDLFGHVNGRWLDEAEIPADKSSWGAFIALADSAEQQVREIITELAGRPADELDEDERKIGDLYTSFMDTATIEARGLEPVQDLLDGAHAISDLPGLSSFLGGLERIGGPGLFGSYITPTGSMPPATSSTSRRAGSGCPTSPTTARRSSPRSARNTSPTSSPC